MKIRENNMLIKEISYCIVSGLISLIGVWLILGLWGIDWNVPFNYSGDTFGALTAAQNFISGNGRFLFPNMGAPGQVNVANLPDITNTSYFGLWFLSLFIKESGFLINVFYVLTFSIISITTTISLRAIGRSPLISIFGGVLYSFLPYHLYRGESHLFLSTYAIVPLGCVVILWIMNGELEFNKKDNTLKNWFKNIASIFNKKIYFCLITAVLIGFDSTYYIFFICLGIVFATLWNLIEEKNLKKVIMPLIILGVIAIVMVINLIPYFGILLNGVEDALSGTRSPRDVEHYGLKFIQLILPVIGHRIPLFSKVRGRYEDNISISFNENHASSLGLLISIGFIISLFIAMKKNKDNERESLVIKNSAILNVFILILGSIGGISSLIAFLVSQVRCYNRLSIFIAFYSIIIVGFYIEKKINRMNNTLMRVLTITSIGILSILDMTTEGNQVKYTQDNELYYSNRNFVKNIEAITPEGSMIFQLPFVDSDHHAGVENMGIYEQFYPFIHSTSLKWSYRAQMDSEAEMWQKIVANMPVDEMLKHLAGVGFKGIYIDKFGYKQEEYEKITNDIRSITGEEPIVSNNGRMEYFYLEEYMNNLNQTFNENEKKIYSNWNNSLYTISHYGEEFNVSNNFNNTLISGWGMIEPWGIWSEGHTATIGFNVLDNSKDLNIEMNLDLFPDPTKFSVYINGNMAGEYTQSGSVKIIVPISKDLIKEQDGVYPINVEISIDNPKSPGGVDGRTLGIGIKTYRVHPE